MRGSHAIFLTILSRTCFRQSHWIWNSQWHDLVGGFNPLEKYQSNWESSPTRGENKKCLKPRPSDGLKSLESETVTSIRHVMRDGSRAVGTFASSPPQLPQPKQVETTSWCMSIKDHFELIEICLQSQPISLSAYVQAKLQCKSIKWKQEKNHIISTSSGKRPDQRRLDMTSCKVLKLKASPMVDGCLPPYSKAGDCSWCQGGSGLPMKWTHFEVPAKSTSCSHSSKIKKNLFWTCLRMRCICFQNMTFVMPWYEHMHWASFVCKSAKVCLTTQTWLSAAAFSSCQSGQPFLGTPCCWMDGGRK